MVNNALSAGVGTVAVAIRYSRPIAPCTTSANQVTARPRAHARARAYKPAYKPYYALASQRQPLSPSLTTCIANNCTASTAKPYALAPYSLTVQPAKPLQRQLASLTTAQRQPSCTVVSGSPIYSDPLLLPMLPCIPLLPPRLLVPSS